LEVVKEAFVDLVSSWSQSNKAETNVWHQERMKSTINNNTTTKFVTKIVLQNHSTNAQKVPLILSHECDRDIISVQLNTPYFLLIACSALVLSRETHGSTEVQHWTIVRLKDFCQDYNLISLTHAEPQAEQEGNRRKRAGDLPFSLLHLG
jgi:hypothetical protein